MACGILLVSYFGSKEAQSVGQLGFFFSFLFYHSNSISWIITVWVVILISKGINIVSKVNVY